MRRGIAILLASGLIAAGCGDDDEEGSGGGPAASTTTTGAETAAGGDGASGGGATAVSLTEFAIDPANPEVKAGTTTFAVTNDGSAPHALEIEGNGVEEETEVLEGGGSAELTVDLEPGEYEWYCPVGNHAAQGMEGTLTVE